MSPKALSEGLADGFEVGGDGFVAEGIEDAAFGSYGGAFDLLLGVAGDEEESDAGFIGGSDGDGGPVSVSGWAVAASQVAGGGQRCRWERGWRSATDGADFKAAMSKIFGNDGC